MRIGIDLGGTKIEAVVARRAGVRAVPQARHGRRAATTTAPSRRSRHSSRDAEQVVGRATVGIGIPGAISPATGLIKNANSTWLNGRPLSEDLGGPARRAGAARQRRELHGAVGGGGRRGGGAVGRASA